jgi:hypothetical protein
MNHGKHGNHGQLPFADETFLIRKAMFEASKAKSLRSVFSVFSVLASFGFA